MAILGFLTSTKRDKLNNSNSAFTLVEVIVVMSIIVVLSTILVGYTRESGKRLILTTTEAKMLSLISRAKFLSIETFFKEQEGPGNGEKICGYGVHVEGNELFIFQDKVASQDPCSSSNYSWNTNNSNDFKMGGELDRMIIDTQIFKMTSTLQNIVFIPPDPDIVINGDKDSEDYTSEGITINLVDDNDEGFTIKVDNVGQVKTD